jgi:hypothetical protein
VFQEHPEIFFLSIKTKHDFNYIHWCIRETFCEWIRERIFHLKLINKLTFTLKYIFCIYMDGPWLIHAFIENKVNQSVKKFFLEHTHIQPSYTTHTHHFALRFIGDLCWRLMKWIMIMMKDKLWSWSMWERCRKSFWNLIWLFFFSVSGRLLSSHVKCNARERKFEIFFW